MLSFFFCVFSLSNTIYCKNIVSLLTILSYASFLFVSHSGSALEDTESGAKRPPEFGNMASIKLSESL